MTTGIKKKKSFFVTLLQCCFMTFIYSLPQLVNANSAITTKPSDSSSIKVGSTIALTGVVGPHGRNVTLGSQIYFDRINAAGGIAGRKIQFITLDNQYEPDLAGRLTRQLIDKENVLALVGLHGSGIVAVILPIAIEKKTLLFGVWSGPDSLYKSPPDRYAINLRPSYAEEVTETIKGLLSIGVKPNEFAFFTQDDPSGDSVYSAAIRTLKASGYKDAENLPHGRYERNTLNVELGLANILDQFKKTPPKIMILGGLTEPNEKFFALARKEFPHTRFVVISGQMDTKTLTKNDDDYVIAAQVVPPLDSDLTAIREYHEDLKKYGKGAKSSYISLNSYMSARLFVVGLERAVAQDKLTREGLIDVFEEMKNVDIGIGIPISYNKSEHTGMHTIWVTVYRDGKFVLTDWGQLKK